MNLPLVCHITLGHKPDDDRIFYKEIRSLANNGYRVILIAPSVGYALPSYKNVSFRLFRPAGYLKNIWKAYQLAKEVKAQIYHIHEFELLPLFVYLKYKYRRKLIYDAHESIFWFFIDFSRRNIVIRFLTGLIAQYVEYLYLRGSDYVITVTPWVAKALKRFHPKVAIVYNFPIVDCFRELSNNESENLILYHGQLVPGRNIELMIEAMVYVKLKYPNARLNLVGSIGGEYKKSLLQLISKLNLNNLVQILPAVPYKEIPNLIKRASIGLVSMQLNESYRRSIQVKTFEFMAAGKPVLGPDVPSIRKYVVEEEAGLIVKPLTPHELAKKIIFLLDHPEVREKMGAKGRKAVLEKYNWEKTLPTLIAVYKAVNRC